MRFRPPQHINQDQQAYLKRFINLELICLPLGPCSRVTLGLSYRRRTASCRCATWFPPGTAARKCWRGGLRGSLGKCRCRTERSSDCWDRLWRPGCTCRKHAVTCKAKYAVPLCVCKASCAGRLPSTGACSKVAMRMAEV